METTFSFKITTAKDQLEIEETSEILKEAATAFETEYSTKVNVDSTPPGDDERGDLVTAITVVAASISALVAVLNYLKTRKPNIRYTIRRGNREYKFDREIADRKLESQMATWAEDATADEDREFLIELELDQ